MVSQQPQIALLSPAVDTGNIGDAFIETAIRRLLGEAAAYERFSIRRELTRREIERINAMDKAVLCGTNLYQYEWESALTPHALEQMRVPVIPLGLGSSAQKLTDITVSDMTRRMIRALHDRCELGGVRDPHSLQVVRNVGVDNVELTGCPVLFWSGRTPRAPRTPPTRVLITARNWLMHRWPDNVDHPVQIAFLRRVIEAFAPTQIQFVCHEDYDDRLIEPLGLDSHQVIATRDAGRYLRLYSDPTNVVLASRLHAGMLALAHGVPVVFVSHDTRTQSFCDMMNLPRIDLFAEGAADEAIAAIHQMLEDDGASELFERIVEPYRRLEQSTTRFLSINELPMHRSKDQPAAFPPT